MAADYTAEQLASLTGVPAGTLRVWESRYGFPEPTRLSNNRKRYDDRHVEEIAAVLEHRRGGLSLAAAIERARDGVAQVPRSMFAAVRAARPDLPVRVMAKRALIALSRAVEDEHAARATGGVLLGSFQHERFYEPSRRRWRSLARTAELAIVLADFSAYADPPGGPVEVPLSEPHPLEREWTVVVHSAGAYACLAAWEVPPPRELPDEERRFELLWTCDPQATRAALAATAGVLGDNHPDLVERLDHHLREPAPVGADVHFADDLTSRAFAYLAEAG